MENNYRIGVKEGLYFLCWLVCFYFVLVGLYCLKEKLLSACTERSLGSTDTYLRPSLRTNWGFYMSFHIESQQSCEGGALACTSLTGPVGEGKQPVCAGQLSPHG